MCGGKMTNCNVCHKPTPKYMHFLQNELYDTWRHEIHNICEYCIKEIIQRYEKKNWTVEEEQK